MDFKSSSRKSTPPVRQHQLAQRNRSFAPNTTSDASAAKRNSRARILELTCLWCCSSQRLYKKPRRADRNQLPCIRPASP